MNRKHWRAGIGVPFALLSTVALMAASAPSPKPECKVAAEWAAANRAEIPKTYEAFITMPLAYRKAAYNVLPAAERRQLWTVQLSRYLAPSSGLSEADRAMVRETIQHLAEYVDPNTGQAAIARDHLTERAQRQFGMKRAKAMFAMLGPESGPTRDVAVNQASIFGATMDILITAAKAVGLVSAHQGPNCSCSVQSDWCGSSSHCTGGGCVTVSGCGTVWAYNCDGLCYGNKT